MTTENQQPGDPITVAPTPTPIGEAGRRGVKDRIQEDLAATARSLAGEQKLRAAKRLEMAVRAIRKTSEDLHKENFDTSANYVDRFAEQVDHFSGYLRDMDLSEVLNDAEAAIRRSPGTAVVMGVLAGFVIARFLKSSSPAPAYKGPYGTIRGTTVSIHKE